MIKLPLSHAKKILCLGAHSDDIEIGAGGTLLKLAEARPDLSVHWVVFSAPGLRTQEAENSAKAFLKNVSEKNIRIGASFRESYFPTEWDKIKELFEEIRKNFDPDIIFTHTREDRHQDHRVLSDLAWNTFRNHLIFEYEIPKWDGDLGVPNLYVELTPEQAKHKVDLLMEHFKTQQTKHWFSEDLFYSLMRIRGIESGCRYAEGFYGRKIVL
ncbi:MAG: PIG-L deacetylase family protein [Nibricoccus sp.]